MNATMSTMTMSLASPELPDEAAHEASRAGPQHFGPGWFESSRELLRGMLVREWSSAEEALAA